MIPCIMPTGSITESEVAIAGKIAEVSRDGLLRSGTAKRRHGTYVSSRSSDLSSGSQFFQITFPVPFGTSGLSIRKNKVRHSGTSASE